MNSVLKCYHNKIISNKLFSPSLLCWIYFSHSLIVIKIMQKNFYWIQVVWCWKLNGISQLADLSDGIFWVYTKIHSENSLNVKRRDFNSINSSLGFLCTNNQKKNDSNKALTINFVMLFAKNVEWWNQYLLNSAMMLWHAVDISFSLCFLSSRAIARTKMILRLLLCVWILPWCGGVCADDKRRVVE